MICELCGKSANKMFRLKLEGGIVSVCEGCTKHGEVVEKISEKKPKPKKNQPPRHEDSSISLGGGLDVVDDYGARVKAAREKRSMTQDDLGKQVNEPHSLIHRIELGRYEPSPDLAKKLEKKLNIKLLIPHEDVDELVESGEAQEVTLGDLVVVRKRNK